MGAVLLFDGVCNVCNATVNFIMKRDKNGYFQFASLQSDYAQQQLTQAGYKTSDFDSVVLMENGKFYFRSTAALKVAKQLNGLWPLLYVFIILPPFIRNAIYNFIARNRYKWFGKRDTCRIATPEEKSRFID
ncbi:MAG: thiol-disulfide oxidoreductase DCC family protein [Chitinophagales bacterium]|nr:thiol-disulfide oxidoreductase DCC family protein [Chitinophagales bacterium]